MKNVCVFLSTYNGEKYLRQLLDSVLAQEGVAVNLFVRDDGSNDGTREILEQYAAKYGSIKLEFAENIGYAKSFWSLFKHENIYDYYAFCDQDDIWGNDKLLSAVELLETENKDIPLLYTSDVVAVNNDLCVVDDCLFKVDGVLNFYQSLQKSVVPGCTFVFNQAAVNILKLYDGYMESHDWATYCIVNAFGKVLFDKTPHIKYRLHGNNAIGKSGKFKDFQMKIKRLFHRPTRSRSRFAKDFYDCYKEMLSEDYASAAKILGYYRIAHKKTQLYQDKRFKGGTFKLMVLLGRV